MALNKNGMDLGAIRRDQKAIDKLPNKGRASTSHEKALNKKKGKPHLKPNEGGNQPDWSSN